MALLILSAIVQLALIVHVFRTGRPVYWAFIIFLGSLLGVVAYLLVEVLPELAGSRGGRQAMRSLKKTVNPGGELRQLEREHRVSGSVETTRHLAGELVANGKYLEASELYEKALTGLYAHDPDLLLGLAQAQFANRQYDEARGTLERITRENPDYRSADGHLLYARAAEACGDLESAQHEYEAVSRYYAGAEAKYRYAVLLERLGRPAEALELLKDIVTTAELAPRHYRRAQKEWIRGAKEGIRQLSG